MDLMTEFFDFYNLKNKDKFLNLINNIRHNITDITYEEELEIHLKGDLIIKVPETNDILDSQITRLQSVINILKDETSLGIIGIIFSVLNDIWYIVISNSYKEHFINLSEQTKQDLLDVLLDMKSIGMQITYGNELINCEYNECYEHDFGLFVTIDIYDEEKLIIKLNQLKQIIKTLRSCKMVQTLMGE